MNVWNSKDYYKKHKSYNCIRYMLNQIEEKRKCEKIKSKTKQPMYLFIWRKVSEQKSAKII